MGKKFGLATMRALMRQLDHPELSFKSVLVAGTNGKGSVSAYLDAALRAGSLKVGRYTSPHLIDIRERITVSGRNIGNADFETLVLQVRSCAEQLKKRGVIENHPNHFEILTTVAFLYFKKKAVDIAVLEVGLGGRLDATNVASPLVSAIVSIDFDHEEYLGKTLSAIAREKAGVARRNRTLVVGPVAREAERTILEVAKKRRAIVSHAFGGVTVGGESSAAGLTVLTPRGRYTGLRPLAGAHQRTNLVVAIRTLEALVERGLKLDRTQAIKAMSSTFWPGRLERFEGQPPFLLDGAHNHAGAAALARHLEESATPYVLVFGAMRDKHVREMADELFRGAKVVIATRVRMTRAATTNQLGQIGLALGQKVIEEPSINFALSRASGLARPGETVVVAGSLYLVGAVRKRLVRGLKPHPQRAFKDN